LSGSIAAFSSYSPAAASTRVRLYDWFEHLGLTVEAHCYAGLRNASPATLARNVGRVLRAEADLRRFSPVGRTVIMSREASPLSRGGSEQRILSTAGHSVFDVDDAIYLGGSIARSLLDPPGKFARCVAAADVVIAGNDHLAEAAATHAQQVVVIPSCVEPDDYTPRTGWALLENPTLVWLGSGATEQYLEPLLPVLDRLHTTVDFCLNVISTGVPNPAMGGRDWIRFVPWRLDTFAAELAKGDVALAPLSDTPFARGKCAYKLLQYAATGLPMIGSPVGANRLALDRFEGLAVEQATDWYDALAAMLGESAEARADRATVALTAVRQWYSFAAWSKDWLRATAIAPD
jgi:glycosyltransferase involved in cell wall biosynthesis